MSAPTINGHGPGPGESPAGLIPGQRAPLADVTVTKLPAEPAGAPEPADAIPPGYGPVIEDARPADVDPADLADDDEDQEDEQPAAPAAAVAEVERVPVLVRARRVVTHRHVRTVGRQGMYVLGGARVVVSRTRDARTTARHERLMRAAEVAGDHAAVQQWQQSAEAHRKPRHERRMSLLAAPVILAKSLVYGAAGLFAFGILLAVTAKDPSQILRPLQDVTGAIRWALSAAAGLWHPISTYGPWAGLLALWAVGRARTDAPSWLAPDGQGANGPGGEVVPDEGAILSALRNLGISRLDKAFKAGWQPRWVSGTGRVGGGWHTQLQLPQGVTVEMIGEKKKLLAHNLMRLPIEVWATEPRNQPTVLDLWVADQGSLSGPVPPFPLLTTGVGNYFEGVPIGVSQRGDSVYAALMARNYMVGGIMGTGKSSVTRNILLGAMLDPLVDIDVYVMAFNSDYDAMRPRLRTLVKGDDDEQVEQALKALRELRGEVTRRGQILDSSGGEELALTRETALRDSRMRPRIVVFDECHELFEHKEYGEEAAELAVKVLKKARKCGITLIFVTVSPTASSIPKDVTRNTSNRVAFALGDHVANDGILGAGRYKAGITATTLSPGEDIGTALTVGFTKNPFELVRMHFVEKSKRVDEITPIVQRALALREAADLDQAEPADAVPDLDPLADIAAVLAGTARMRTQEVLSGLAVRNPAAYRRWTLADLTAALEAAGAPTYKSSGLMTVSGELVRAAIANRAEESDSDEVDQ